jgi:hypothetical protein
LCQCLDLEAESGWQKILKCLSDRAKRVESVDAEADDAFDLRSVVTWSVATTAEHVYLSWDPLRGEVDDIAFADLARYFAWIWYPASDDIQIFDEPFSWLLLIGHEGDVSVARLDA